MSKDFQKELQAQENLVFIWKALNLVVAVVALLIGYNGHPFIMMIIFVAQGIHHLIRWPAVRDELQRRQKYVAIKIQIRNLYVFTETTRDGHETVAQAFERALEMLKETGNPHEVRVHMAMFRDVYVFTSYYDTAGRRHNERKERPAGSATETWEQYLQWCDQFYKDDTDKRLRQLRKDNEGFEWVNKNYFNQEYASQN